MGPYLCAKAKPFLFLLEGIELAGGVQSGVQITELEEEVESIGSIVGQFGYIIYLCVSKFALNLLTFIYIYICNSYLGPFSWISLCAKPFLLLDM